MPLTNELKPPRLLLRVILAAIAASIALVAFRDTSASHTVYMVDDPYNNPGGLTCGTQQCNEDRYLWGANVAWIGQSTQLGICNDWGGANYNAMPLGIRQAVTAWEGVLPGAQLSTGCGLTGYGLNFKKGSGHPCGLAWACIPGSWYGGFTYDGGRTAHYRTTTDIWFNTITYPENTWTHEGWKAVAGHELGHVFGLDEQYTEPGSCNNYVSSVMNLATNTGACDPLYGDPTSLPNSTDSNRVGSFFWLMPVQGNVVSYGANPGVLYLNFTDLSFVEWSYRIRIYWCCDPIVGEVLWFTWDHAASVAKRGVTNGIPWYRGSSPAGWYKMCGWTNNTLSGPSHYFCMPYKWVP